MKFKTVDETIRVTMIVAITCCVTLAVAFLVAFIFQYNKINEAYTKALVLDTAGKVYEVTPVAASDMRKYEYEIILRLLSCCGMRLMRAHMRIT